MEKNWGRVLVSAGRIRRRLRALGLQITQDFAGQPLVLVAVLKGSFVFLGDLIRHIHLPLEVDFLEVSSYGLGWASSRRPRLLKDITISIAGKTVLLVDDILDSGHTLEYVVRHLKKKRPRRIKTCVLLDKTCRREVALQPDYAGFSIGNHFVVGYGLDYKGGLRHLPFVAVMPPEKKRRPLGGNK